MLYLRAAGLHFRLFAFFDSPNSKQYVGDLLELWTSTASFLECAFNLVTSAGNLLINSPNYILQMIIAAAFTLLKLLNSFFAAHMDVVYGRTLFTRTIQVIRSISVTTNDLPNRLAEVLAQLWRASGAASRQMSNGSVNFDNSLQLKVKCRMSMSLVFDSVWRWREKFRANGRGNLDCMYSRTVASRKPLILWEAAVKNPTNPESAVESSATSVADHSLAPSNTAFGDTITPDWYVQCPGRYLRLALQYAAPAILLEP